MPPSKRPSSSPPTVRDLGEDALIELLTRGLSTGENVIVGPGDDCAVLKGETPNRVLLFKTDCVVEGVHFRTDEDPARVGRKAMARSLSDIAAMGGSPAAALVTLVAPPDREVAWAEGLYRGMKEMAARFNMPIVGGETSSSPPHAPVAIVTAALLGYAENFILRSGASPGDQIAVTGTLGNSLSGRHLDFIPRIPEGQFLAQGGRVAAMMDLSDGLAADLPRLARASGVGFRVDSDRLPLAEGATARSALGDGEDYELVFTIRPDAWPQLERDWTQAFPDVPLTVIGEITDPGTSSFGSAGSDVAGWQHFHA